MLCLHRSALSFLLRLLTDRMALNTFQVSSSGKSCSVHISYQSVLGKISNLSELFLPFDNHIFFSGAWMILSVSIWFGFHIPENVT